MFLGRAAAPEPDELERYLERLYDEAMEGEEEEGSFEQHTFLEDTVDEIRLRMINVSFRAKKDRNLKVLEGCRRVGEALDLAPGPDAPPTTRVQGMNCFIEEGPGLGTGPETQRQPSVGARHGPRLGR